MRMYQIFIGLFLLVNTSCNSNQNNTSKDAELNAKKEMEVVKDQGVITKVSAQNFESTYTTLVEIINNNPNLRIVAQLDHQANAASVGLKLNPTRIIMFGNPKLGTPLMQNMQTTGLDLPQKILVWQDDNDVVKVSYNDPMYLRGRHGIDGKNDLLQKINDALDTITNSALSNN